MKKISAIIIFSILLSSCSWFKAKEEPTPIKTYVIDKYSTIIDPDFPGPLSLKTVQWKVWNKERIRSELDSLDPNQAFFVLTTENYENLSNNTNDLKEFIKNQWDIIEYYQTRIKQAEERAKKLADDNTDVSIQSIDEVESGKNQDNQN